MFRAEPDRARPRRRSTRRRRTGSRSSTRTRNATPRRTGASSRLQAIEFAFWALNDTLRHAAGRRHAQSHHQVPANTIVIASAASNGGGAALAAAEHDTDRDDRRRRRRRAERRDPADAGHHRCSGAASPSRTAARRSTTISRTPTCYSDCAVAARAQLAATPGPALIVPTFAAARCQSLKDAGLLTATTTAAQADEALAQAARLRLLAGVRRDLRVAGGTRDVFEHRCDVRELVLARERRGQPLQLQLRRGRRGGQSGAGRRRRRSRRCSRTATACRPAAACS